LSVQIGPLYSGLSYGLMIHGFLRWKNFSKLLFDFGNYPVPHSLGFKKKAKPTKQTNRN